MKGLRFWWGNGKRSGSFFPMLGLRDETYWLFALWTYGRIEIQFQSIKTKSIYKNIDKRMEILKKLNKIPGVNISENSIDKRPSIPYPIFKNDSNLTSFLEIWEEYIETIKNNT